MAMSCVFFSAAGHAHSPVNQTTSIADAGQGRMLIAAPYGLLRSDDKGFTATWICDEAFGGTPDDIFNREVLAFAGGVLVRAGGIVARTDDGGCSWQPVAALAKARVRDMDLGKTVAWATGPADKDKPNDASHVWRAAGKGVWLPVHKGSGLDLSAVAGGIDSDHLALVAGTDNKGVSSALRTLDGGKNWQAVTLPDGLYKVQPIPFGPLADGAVLMLRAHQGMTGGLVRSVDGGKNWSVSLAMPDGVEIDATTWLAQAATPTLVVASALSGVHQTQNEGATFAKLPKGPLIECLHSVGERLWACTDNYIDGHALMVSDNGGQSWKGRVCLHRVTGPLACGQVAAICQPKMAELVTNTGRDPSQECGPVAPGEDGGAAGGEDAGSARGGADAPGQGDSAAADVVPADTAGLDSGGTGVKPTVLPPDNGGCHSSPGGQRRGGTAWAVLLLVVAAAGIRRRSALRR